MARQTRSQRRARREAQAKSQGGSSSSSSSSSSTGSASISQCARQRQAAVRPSAQPVKGQGGRRTIPGSGSRRFIAESWGELKKVEWPGQSQLIQGTVVVLVACVIVGVYLWGADLVFKRLVEN